MLCTVGTLYIVDICCMQLLSVRDTLIRLILIQELLHRALLPVALHKHLDLPSQSVIGEHDGKIGVLPGDRRLLVRLQIVLNRLPFVTMTIKCHHGIPHHILGDRTDIVRWNFLQFQRSQWTLPPL